MLALSQQLVNIFGRVDVHVEPRCENREWGEMHEVAQWRVLLRLAHGSETFALQHHGVAPSAIMCRSDVAFMLEKGLQKGHIPARPVDGNHHQSLNFVAEDLNEGAQAELKGARPTQVRLRVDNDVGVWQKRLDFGFNVGVHHHNRGAVRCKKPLVSPFNERATVDRNQGLWTTEATAQARCEQHGRYRLGVHG